MATIKPASEVISPDTALTVSATLMPGVAALPVALPVLPGAAVPVLPSPAVVPPPLVPPPEMTPPTPPVVTPLFALPVGIALAVTVPWGLGADEAPLLATPHHRRRTPAHTRANPSPSHPCVRRRVLLFPSTAGTLPAPHNAPQRVTSSCAGIPAGRHRGPPSRESDHGISAASPRAGCHGRSAAAATHPAGCAAPDRTASTRGRSAPAPRGWARRRPRRGVPGHQPGADPAGQRQCGGGPPSRARDSGQPGIVPWREVRAFCHLDMARVMESVTSMR